MVQQGELDLRTIRFALARKKHWIIGPTLLALVISLAIVNMITPRYRSEARILIDGRENVFLRPSGERIEERTALDPEAVTSQVQLVLSRDLAREVIKANKLADYPEFDPILRGISPVKAVLALVGIGRDPFRMTPEERVLDAYFERLTAFAVDKSRVIVVEFQSSDPDLAARVSNSIAATYLTMQQNSRQQQARAASQWLSREIESLRPKVEGAESRVEDFRSKSSLFIGTNNTSLSNQQMGELNTQLNAARAQKSDLESRSRLIREALQSGRPIESAEFLNTELMRRLSEQRVTLRAQLAEQSSTLLDQHPRIKELKAQLGDLDRQIRDEAAKVSRSLENDARIASARVDGLTASLEQVKKVASSSNGQDVQLRALEREAKAQRDLLESYLAKYREATTRENIDAAPSDGRIISGAVVSNTPAYPKKLPIVLIATLGTLLLTAGFIATSELLRMTAPRSDAGPAATGVPLLTFRAPSYDEVSRAPHAADPELENVAQGLLSTDMNARKVTVLGTGRDDAISATALTLARKMAKTARVVLVDLSHGALSVRAASIDPDAPGLTELIRGEATFGQIVTRDGRTGLHLVAGGHVGADRALLQSPRVTMMLDALFRVYDHVVLDAGNASDLPAGLLTSEARAVVVPDVSLSPDARKRFIEQLRTLGFAEVTILTGAALPSENIPNEVAA
jgi:uncharacterized protein involved in exopolysaccharide biosynthesis